MATYFTDDFADFAADWTERYNTGGTFSVSSGDLIPPPGNSADWRILSWNDIDSDADRDDVEILLLVTTAATVTNTYFGIIRGSGADESATNYSVMLRSDAVRIYVCNGADTPSQIGTASKTINGSTDYWFRFRANGSTLRLRVWADGSGEPGTWDVDITDTVVPGAGWVGLGNYSTGNVAAFKQIGVGTNGDTAPASAGGSSWDADLTESASATDTASASFVINASVSITESASGSDTQTASFSASGSASVVESASATDTATAAATVVASLLESASATDLASATLIAAVAIVEAASSSDTPSASFSAAGTVGVVETANATDTITAAATLLRAIVEAGNATDAATAAATVVAMLTESAVATDTVTAAAPGTWNVSVTELAAAVDTIAAYLDAGVLARAPAALHVAGPGRPLALTLGAARRALGNILKPNS